MSILDALTQVLQHVHIEVTVDLTDFLFATLLVPPRFYATSEIKPNKRKKK